MPEYLHDFDPNEIKSVFPCPVWVSLSKMLNNRERRNGGKPLDPMSIDIYAVSCVGSKVAPSLEHSIHIINLLLIQKISWQERHQQM